MDRLLYYETYGEVLIAIRREKQLKNWRREKKIALIEKTNPQWKDLSRGWYEAITTEGDEMQLSRFVKPPQTTWHKTYSTP